MAFYHRKESGTVRTDYSFYDPHIFLTEGKWYTENCENKVLFWLSITESEKSAPSFSLF
jgi:hypothetical protein